MNKQFALMLSVGIMSAMISGCSATEPAPSTPLPQGVFSTTDDCDLRITIPSGAQTTQTNTFSLAFEINDRGVLIGADGEEIAVGQTVAIEGLQFTYTRIEATANGVIIHSTTSGSVNNISVSGTAIATFTVTEAGEVLYDFTQTWIDSDGFSYNMGCTFLLVP